MTITDRLAELESRTPRFQAMGWGNASPARGGTLPAGTVAGQFVVPNGDVTGTVTQALNVLVAQAFDLAEAIKIDQTLIECTTLGTSNTYRVGFYYDGGGGRPGGLLLDAGTQSTGSTGVKTFTTALTLPQGRIWVVTVSQGGTAAVMRSVARPVVQTSLPSVPTAGGSFLNATGVSGALPATAPAMAGTPIAGATRVYFRAA